MNDKSIGEIWQNLSIWQKSTIMILLIMWLAFSAEIVSFLVDNVVFAVIYLCLLWLGYVALALVITRVSAENY